MNMKELQDRHASGEPLLVVEYRGSTAETIEYRDKITRMAMKLTTLSHTCEMGSKSILIRERVPESFNPQTFTPPFTKGQFCVWRADSLSRDKGLYRGEGVLEVLENPGGHGLAGQSPRANSAQAGQGRGDQKP